MAPLFCEPSSGLGRRSRGGRPHLLRTVQYGFGLTCANVNVDFPVPTFQAKPSARAWAWCSGLLLQKRCIWTHPADLIRCTHTHSRLQLLQTAGWIAIDHQGLSSAVIDYEAHVICRLAVHRAQGYDQTGPVITLARLRLIKYWLFVPWPLGRWHAPSALSSIGILISCIPNCPSSTSSSSIIN